MKLETNTKDALLFSTGLMGIIAQAIMYFLGLPVSVPLLGAFLAMCGIAIAPNIFSGKGGS
jgi:hypothetical protein